MAVEPSRRAFIAELGRGLAGAVILTACGASESAGTTATNTTPTASTTPSTNSSSSGDGSVASSSTSPSNGTGVEATVPASPAVSWERVDLGFVSAYILSRDGEAVIVDTGVAGSETAIEATLFGVGLDWESVAHVIVTHEHGDHAGSLQPVLERATSAMGYAASPDVDNIATPRPLQVVRDGDIVFGLRIVATPGHTAGHISVLDPGRILVTGDAINNTPNLSGPNPRFTADMDAAVASAGVLATLDYEVALFGHGAPIESGAASQVADLAASL